MTPELQHIIALVKDGGIGVMPTDTIYGIVASAHHPASVARVEAMKAKDRHKPLIVLITQTVHMRTLCPTLSSDDLARADLLWARRGDDYAFLARTVDDDTLNTRGISIILPCTDPQTAYLHKGTGGLAFRRITKNARCPHGNALYDVIDAVGPLIATSANRSGAASVHHHAQAQKIFGDACDFYSGGTITETQPSLVVRLESGVPPLQIVRQ